MTTLPLTVDLIRKAAPSAFAPAPIAGVSDRYRYFPTTEAIDLFRSVGWEPVKASEKRVRLEERRGFQTHVIRFARTEDLATEFRVSETRPEIVLSNSHDRSSAFQIDAGLFRKVCANGLVVADTTFAGISIRHVDVNAQAFLGAARSVTESAPVLLDTVKRWQAVTLNDATRTEFARQAVALRWESLDGLLAGLRPSDLLTSRRYADSAPDLWTTFNVIQENLVKGTRYQPAAELGRRNTRQLKSPAVDRDINKRLWALAATFSNN